MIRFLKSYEWKVIVNSQLADKPVKNFNIGDTDDSLPKMLQSRLVTRRIAEWVVPKPERAVAPPAPEHRTRRSRTAADSD
jgi:hypothetical protein